jgi:hypothetical protein
MEEECECDQYHKERPGQNTDPSQVVLDMSVIRVEFRRARCRHECSGFTHLSSVFLGHNDLLLIQLIAGDLAKVFFTQQSYL